MVASAFASRFSPSTDLISDAWFALTIALTITLTFKLFPNCESTEIISWLLAYWLKAEHSDQPGRGIQQQKSAWRRDVASIRCWKVRVILRWWAKKKQCDASSSVYLVVTALIVRRIKPVDCSLLCVFSWKSSDFFSLVSLVVSWSNQNPMASGDIQSDESLYPIAVLIDELRNEDVQVRRFFRKDARYTRYSLLYWLLVTPE